jgi:uncharacterized protein
MMTYEQRLILINQYRIMAMLDPENKQEYENNQEVLASGYQRYFKEFDQRIVEDLVPDDIVIEVEQILNMFRALKWSSDRNGHKAPKDRHLFEGFDGNNDVQYGIAQYLRSNEGKWDELAKRPDNSHSLVLPRYQRMMEVWERYEKSFVLSNEQIDAIGAA